MELAAMEERIHSTTRFLSTLKSRPELLLRDVVEISGMPWRSAQRARDRLLELKKIHISDWMTERNKYLPMYSAGYGENAKKPLSEADRAALRDLEQS